MKSVPVTTRDVAGEPAGNFAGEMEVTEGVTPAVVVPPPPPELLLPPPEEQPVNDQTERDTKRTAVALRTGMFMESRCYMETRSSA